MSKDIANYKYKNLYTYNPLVKKKPFNKEITFDEKFDLNKFTKSKLGSINFDKTIKELCLKNKNNIDLLLLLRCKTSNAMYRPVNELYKKARRKKKYSLDINEMLSIVLEDDGERYLRLKREEKQNNQTVSIFKMSLDKIPGFFKKKDIYMQRYKRVAFNYETIERLIKQVEIFQLKEKLKHDLINNLSTLFNWLIFPKIFNVIFAKNKDLKIFKKNYQVISPFCAEIIYTFNEMGNAELATWTKWQVRSNKYLKAYVSSKSGLKEILLSKWALLNFMPIKSINDACIQYGFKKSKIGYIEEVMISYKKIYPELSEILKEHWSPKKKEKIKIIISKINHKEKTLKDLDKLLDNIAEAVQFRGYKPTEDNTNKIKDNDGKGFLKVSDIVENIPDEIEEDLEPLDLFLNRLIKKLAFKHVGNQIEKDRGENNKLWEKQPEKKKAWILFSEIDLGSNYDNNDFEKILFECNKILIHRNNEASDNQEIEKLHNLSWLSKRFNFNKTSVNIFNELFEILKEISEDEQYIVEFNKENISNKINPDLKDLLYKFLLIKSKPDESGVIQKNFRFNKDEYLKPLRLQFVSSFNPKKSRKELLINLVKDLLIEKNII